MLLLVSTKRIFFVKSKIVAVSIACLCNFCVCIVLEFVGAHQKHCFWKLLVMLVLLALGLLSFSSFFVHCLFQVIAGRVKTGILAYDLPPNFDVVLIVIFCAVLYKSYTFLS